MHSQYRDEGCYWFVELFKVIKNVNIFIAIGLSPYFSARPKIIEIKSYLVLKMLPQVFYRVLIYVTVARSHSFIISNIPFPIKIRFHISLEWGEIFRGIELKKEHIWDFFIDMSVWDGATGEYYRGRILVILETWYFDIFEPENY